MKNNTQPMELTNDITDIKDNIESSQAISKKT